MRKSGRNCFIESAKYFPLVDTVKSPSIEVLCVGHACYDLIFPVTEFPVENMKYAVSRMRESAGGPAGNAASLLGKWGALCAFAGLVGEDLYGRRIEEEFSAWGVDTSFLELRETHPTPLSCIIANSKSGSRTIINRKAPGGVLHLTSAALLRRFGGGGPRVLLFDGHETAASLAAMEAFPGALSILDAGSLREGTDVLSRRVDYCIASERFAREVTGISAADGPEAASEALAGLAGRGAKHVAITLGEKGCSFIEDASRKTLPVRSLPALPVRAVDTTAAGDIFHGAFAYGLLRGRDFIGALRLATAAAGLSVKKPGGRDSIPALEDAVKAESGLPGA